ncbi:MAG: DUF1957 domain-containing protein [Actinomycetota bacterium]|nr:DUF1957 domain-containing protein [Actinomycetota bacterium]
MNGYLSILLHTHMPYVRKNGTWPVGEDWLYQVISESYLPILDALMALSSEEIKNCLALTFTPVLCEQLADEYIKDGFKRYLETMIRHTEQDIEDFKYLGDEKRVEIARQWRNDYEAKLHRYLSLDRDILKEFKDLKENGVIEILASATTHAFLPGLPSLESVERQIETGISSHIRHFSSPPEGFWIPECAWRKDLGELLEKYDIRYVPIDPSAIPGLPTAFPHRLKGTRLHVIARSETAHRNVWEEKFGYPSDPNYLDTTKYYLNSGNYYWKVTGYEIPIENKMIYEPQAAKIRAFEHAEHFMNSVISELITCSGKDAVEPGILLASFDTELFGHGWHEGVLWLETLLRSISGSTTVELTVPSAYLEKHPSTSQTTLRIPTSWGDNHDYSTWLGNETDWMWDAIGKAEKQFVEMRNRYGKSSNSTTKRAIEQMERELMILESSDWQYMVAKRKAREYAIERFNSHYERFKAIAGAICEGVLETFEEKLQHLEELDKLSI